MRVAFLAAFALLGESACIVEAPGGDKSPPRTQAVVPQVPPLSTTIGANLDGKVELAASSIVPGRISPGEQAKVTFYFKVLEELDKDYMVFVHVEDAEGRSVRLNLDHRPAGGTYPTTQWRKSETVKDEFFLTLPAGISSKRLNLWAGLWEPQADVRLTLRNPDSVRNDGNNRVLVAQLPIGP
jgi:hypothetical protein